VIGSGISGLSCAWLLSRQHHVTLYEAADRLGGHSNTVTLDADIPIPVDTGFIVYNESTYPNLTALLAHLGVRSTASEMSFAVSRPDLEYSGSSLSGLFAQKRNLVRPRFWRMLAQTLRFYRDAETLLARAADPMISLGDLLDQGGYGAAMQRDHLLPMAAAIWSCSPASVRDYPAAAFIAFCRNHGLLQVRDRPQWRSIAGGSQRYVQQMASEIAGAAGCQILTHTAVRRIVRTPDGVAVNTADQITHFDDVVIACHAPDALRMIADPHPAVADALSSLRTTVNHAVLHQDTRLMPRSRAAWSSWNALMGKSNDAPCITYWMNRLQQLPTQEHLFVTLNPTFTPHNTRASFQYDHPLFDARALTARSALWDRQGDDRMWFCGAYFGAGFHEDGLQSGLAVAEALGGVRRPWDVAGASARTPGPLPARAPRDVGSILA